MDTLATPKLREGENGHEEKNRKKFYTDCTD